MSATSGDGSLQELEGAFAEWARARRDIRAVMVLGSQARIDHPADEWADLDLMIFATDTKRYLSSDEWIRQFGAVWVAARGRTVRGDPEWLVVFEGGVDVDFVFLAAGRIKWRLRILRGVMRVPGLLRILPREVHSQIREAASTTSDVFHRGVRVLVDRDGLIGTMRRAFGQESPQYEVEETRFQDAVKSFWLTAARTAKKLRRGEWWVAKHRCDVLMKELLRQMIEWHARATRGPSVDTWHSGHFLEEWADPRAIEGLQSAFAVYDEDDIWRALLITMELYRWLAQETGEALGYSYPSDADMRIAGLVRRLESGRKSNIP